MKKEKAITLIALVITIIILLILAGITISQLTGNGIFSKVKEAREKWKNAQEKEEEVLGEYQNQMQEYVSGKSREGYGEVINGPQAGGSYNNPYIPAGFTHTVGDGTWNSGYTIKDTSNGNEFVWVPCIVVDGQTSNDILTQTNGDKVIRFGTTQTPGSKYLGTITLPLSEETTDTYARASAIQSSVGTYQGFYIAKYEAGVPLVSGSEVAPGSASDTQTPRSVSSATVWTNITRTSALKAATNMYDASDAKSGLISGACWDTTLQWMVNASDNRANQPNLNYDTNSTGKGFYSNSNTKQIAGTTNVVNNIYNMAGNVWEWTSERNSNGAYPLVGRGGHYKDSGSNYPAAHRVCDYVDARDYYGFRVVLYK